MRSTVVPVPFSAPSTLPRSKQITKWLFKKPYFQTESILRKDGTAREAVEHAVRTLEDNPLFNAGKGSVFTHNGRQEMDASIMDGQTLKAGAVSGVCNIRNPIVLARSIMEKSEHVFLSGSGAADFARQLNLEFMPDAYFFVPMRYEQFLKAKASDSIILDHAPQSTKNSVRWERWPATDTATSLQRPVQGG